MNTHKQQAQEILKEIKDCIYSTWSLNVTTIDEENGEEYSVWNQIFDTEKRLNEFVDKNEEWKRMITKDIPKYDIQKKFIKEIHSNKEPELKAKAEATLKCWKEELEFLEWIYNEIPEEIDDECPICKSKYIISPIIENKDKIDERIQSLKEGIKELEDNLK